MLGGSCSPCCIGWYCCEDINACKLKSVSVVITARDWLKKRSMALEDSKTFNRGVPYWKYDTFGFLGSAISGMHMLSLSGNSFTWVKEFPALCASGSKITVTTSEAVTIVRLQLPVFKYEKSTPIESPEHKNLGELTCIPSTTREPSGVLTCPGLGACYDFNIIKQFSTAPFDDTNYFPTGNCTDRANFSYFTVFPEPISNIASDYYAVSDTVISETGTRRIDLDLSFELDR